MPESSSALNTFGLRVTLHHLQGFPSALIGKVLFLQLLHVGPLTRDESEGSNNPKAERLIFSTVAEIRQEDDNQGDSQTEVAKSVNLSLLEGVTGTVTITGDAELVAATGEYAGDYHATLQDTRERGGLNFDHVIRYNYDPQVFYCDLCVSLICTTMDFLRSYGGDYQRLNKDEGVSLATTPIPIAVCRLAFPVKEIVEDLKVFGTVVGTTIGRFGLTVEVDPSDLLGFQTRLIDFFREHNPGRLSSVKAIMETPEVDEIHVFSKLFRKYRTERAYFGTVREKHANNTQLDRLQSLVVSAQDRQQQNVEQPFLRRILDLFELYDLGPPRVAEALLRQWAGRELELFGMLGCENGPEKNNIPITRRLHAFCSKYHVPLDVMAGLVGKHKDNLELTMAELGHMYGPEPDPKDYLLVPVMTEADAEVLFGARHETIGTRVQGSKAVERSDGIRQYLNTQFNRLVDPTQHYKHLNEDEQNIALMRELQSKSTAWPLTKVDLEEIARLRSGSSFIYDEEKQALATGNLSADDTSRKRIQTMATIEARAAIAERLEQCKMLKHFSMEQVQTTMDHAAGEQRKRSLYGVEIPLVATPTTLGVSGNVSSKPLIEMDQQATARTRARDPVDTITRAPQPAAGSSIIQTLSRRRFDGIDERGQGSEASPSVIRPPRISTSPTRESSPPASLIAFPSSVSPTSNPPASFAPFPLASGATEVPRQRQSYTDANLDSALFPLQLTPHEERVIDTAPPNFASLNVRGVEPHPIVPQSNHFTVARSANDPNSFCVESDFYASPIRKSVDPETSHMNQGLGSPAPQDASSGNDFGIASQVLSDSRPDLCELPAITAPGRAFEDQWNAHMAAVQGASVVRRAEEERNNSIRRDICLSSVGSQTNPCVDLDGDALQLFLLSDTLSPTYVWSSFLDTLQHEHRISFHRLFYLSNERFDNLCSELSVPSEVRRIVSAERQKLMFNSVSLRNLPSRSRESELLLESVKHACGNSLSDIHFRQSPQCFAVSNTVHEAIFAQRVAMWKRDHHRSTSVGNSINEETDGVRRMLLVRCASQANGSSFDWILFGSQKMRTTFHTNIWSAVRDAYHEAIANGSSNIAVPPMKECLFDIFLCDVLLGNIFATTVVPEDLPAPFDSVILNADSEREEQVVVYNSQNIIVVAMLQNCILESDACACSKHPSVRSVFAPHQAASLLSIERRGQLTPTELLELQCLRPMCLQCLAEYTLFLRRHDDIPKGVESTVGDNSSWRGTSLQTEMQWRPSHDANPQVSKEPSRSERSNTERAQSSIAVGPLDLRELMSNGWTAWHRGKKEQAISLWQRIVECSPSSPDASEAQGILSELIDQHFNAAAVHYREACHRNPSSASALFRFANLLETRLGKPQEALQVFQQCAGLGDRAAARRADLLGQQLHSNTRRGDSPNDSRKATRSRGVF